MCCLFVTQVYEWMSPTLTSVIMSLYGVLMWFSNLVQMAFLCLLYQGLFQVYFCIMILCPLLFIKKPIPLDSPVDGHELWSPLFSRSSSTILLLEMRGKIYLRSNFGCFLMLWLDLSIWLQRTFHMLHCIRSDCKGLFTCCIRSDCKRLFTCCRISCPQQIQDLDPIKGAWKMGNMRWQMLKNYDWSSGNGR